MLFLICFVGAQSQFNPPHACGLCDLLQAPCAMAMPKDRSLGQLKKVLFKSDCNYTSASESAVTPAHAIHFKRTPHHSYNVSSIPTRMNKVIERKEIAATVSDSRILHAYCNLCAARLCFFFFAPLLTPTAPDESPLPPLALRAETSRVNQLRRDHCTHTAVISSIHSPLPPLPSLETESNEQSAAW